MVTVNPVDYKIRKPCSTRFGAHCVLLMNYMYRESIVFCYQALMGLTVAPISRSVLYKKLGFPVSVLECYFKSFKILRSSHSAQWPKIAKNGLKITKIGQICSIFLGDMYPYPPGIYAYLCVGVHVTWGSGDGDKRITVPQSLSQELCIK